MQRTPLIRLEAIGEEGNSCGKILYLIIVLNHREHFMKLHKLGVLA